VGVLQAFLYGKLKKVRFLVDALEANRTLSFIEIIRAWRYHAEPLEFGFSGGI